MNVERLTTAEVLPLRRAILRSGTSSTDAGFPGDDDPSTHHLGVRIDGEVVAVSSWYAVAFPESPNTTGWQLRGMAVADLHRHRGLARAMIDAGLDLARQRAAQLVWANARDSALGFYRAVGFEVVGDGFVTPDTGLPHHRIFRTTQ